MRKFTDAMRENPELVMTMLDDLGYVESHKSSPMFYEDMDEDIDWDEATEEIERGKIDR